MKSNRTHQSLERGLGIIEVIAAINGSATLAEIARKTSLPRDTAHHLLQALVEFGCLIQDGRARTYTLAPKLFRLTGRTWTQEQLAEIAMPFLDELSRRTRQGTSLAVLRDGSVTVIAKREPQGPVHVVQEVGAKRPIYCTAVGKALAAWLPEQELKGIIARAVFERMTPRTITSPAAFLRELLVALIGFGVWLSYTTRFRSFQGIPWFSYTRVTLSVPVGGLLMLITTTLKIREKLNQKG